MTEKFQYFILPRLKEIKLHAYSTHKHKYMKYSEFSGI
jgi:hypothetical protein